MSAPLTGLRVGVVGHEVHGLCGCGAPLGASGGVVLPEGGRGPMRALCGECLSAAAEALLAVLRCPAPEPEEEDGEPEQDAA